MSDVVCVVIGKWLEKFGGMPCGFGDGLVESVKVLALGGKERAVHVGAEKMTKVGWQLQVVQRDNEVVVAWLVTRVG